jgi:hypothetical protein
MPVVQCCWLRASVWTWFKLLEPQPTAALVHGCKDIADYLGLTIETISRLLAKFEQENVIRVVPEGLQLMGSTERPLLFDMAGLSIFPSSDKCRD